MDSLVGTYLGDYYLVELIGQGGYATVYRCIHKNTQEEFAIKVAERPFNQEKLTLFLHEANLHSQVQHSAIVRYIDADRTKHFFLVMEYASQGTLGELRGQQLALQVILPLIKQVAEALDYLHGQHIIHCDVKPDNLLVTKKNDVLLCDFGIAVRMTHVVTSAYGTIPYVAPEQLRLRPCPESDQYALAITLYEWLAGVPPFDNVRDILARPAPSLRQKVPTCSEEIEKVILKALMKEPQQRYPSVMAFYNALEQAYRSSASSTPVHINTSIKTPVNHTPNAAVPLPTIGTTRVLGKAIVATVSPIQRTKKIPVGRTGNKVRSVYVYQGHKADISGLAWSPDGLRLASADVYNQIHLWDAQDGNNVSTFRGGSRTILNMLWSPDAACLAIADEVQAVHFLDIQSGKIGFRYHHRVGNPDDIGIGLYYPMAWSQDGRYIISASDDQPLEKWDTLSGRRILVYTGSTGTVRALAWSSDERFLVFGGEDTIVRVWDVTNDTILYEYRGHRSMIGGLCWSPSGMKVASTGADGLVHIWDRSGQGNVLVYAENRPHLVQTLAWSPDGTKIASAGGKRVHIWSAITGQTLEKYEEHTESVQIVKWSPNGEYLASAGDDHSIRVWKVEV